MERTARLDEEALMGEHRRIKQFARACLIGHGDETAHESTATSADPLDGELLFLRGMEEGITSGALYEFFCYN